MGKPVDYDKTGYFTFDAQHQELFDITDDLCRALDDCRAKGDVNMAFSFYENYIKAHFDMEESLMKKNGFPEASDHLKEHRFFIDRFKELIASFEKAEDPANWNRVEEVRYLLIEWSISHIANDDKRLSKYLKK